MTSGRSSPLFHQEETGKHKEILRGPAIFSRLRRRGGGGVEFWGGTLGFWEGTERGSLVADRV